MKKIYLTLIAFTLILSKGFMQTNCSSAIPVCSDASYAGGSPGFGVQELNAGNRGCLIANEHQSTWFGFSPQLTGTIAFSISPSAGPATDYDFAIWGPFPPGTGCPITSQPTRCSYSDDVTATGLNNVAVDWTEDFTGDAWVQQLTIAAPQIGMVYYLLVDNWTGNSNPFTLDWTLSPTNILDCTPPLPVQFLNFEATPIDDVNDVWWTTATEVNSSHFIIEKSNDAIHYSEIGRKPAAGNSNSMLEYSIIDKQPYATTYYRIIQVDLNGDSKTYGPVVVQNEKAAGLMVNQVFPNPAQESFFVDIYAKEPIPVDIYVYDSYGKQCFSETTIIEGQMNHEIQTSTWTTGVYIVKVINESTGLNETRRVVKQ